MRTSPVATRARASRSDGLPSRVRHGVGHFAKTSPSRFAILIFTSLIVVLTIVLMLPISTPDRQGTTFVDALFTAVSTICVTGLTVVDMSTHWSTFGNVAILVGLQVGGIGVLTLASILGLAVSRKLGLQQRLIAASDGNPSRLKVGPVAESQAVRLGEIGGLLATVAVSSLVIELVLTAALVPKLLLYGLDPWAATWKGFYFAASAFTNTGFVPTEEGVEPFRHDPWFLSVIAIGVFLGSIGFPVIFALARRVKLRARLSVHARLTIY